MKILFNYSRKHKRKHKIVPMRNNHHTANLDYLLIHGFTLIELLVVVAIIAVLISILLPALSGVRRQAKMIQCAANQSQIVTAVISYASEENGRFPPSMAVTLFYGNKIGGWPCKLSRDIDGDRRAYGYDELLYNYIGTTLPDYRYFLCPLSPPMSSHRYELNSGYYKNGNSAYLYSSYALYWNYVQGQSIHGNWFVGPTVDSSDGSTSSRLLTCDLLVYSGSVWVCSHPSLRISSSEWEEGIAWSIMSSDVSPIPDLEINAGFIDGSVVRIDNGDIFPVDWGYWHYGRMYLGVPESEVFKE